MAISMMTAISGNDGVERRPFLEEWPDKMCEYDGRPDLATARLLKAMIKEVGTTPPVKQALEACAEAICEAPFLCRPTAVPVAAAANERFVAPSLGARGGGVANRLVDMEVGALTTLKLI